MADTPLTISFQTTSGEVSSASLSLDTDKNTSYYGAEKSTFEINDIVYLKLIPGVSTQNYTLGSSYGDLILSQQDLPYLIEEFLNFENTKEIELSYIPYVLDPTYIFESEWIGDDIGIILRADKKITIVSEGIGILKCTYWTLGDRLQLSNCSLSYTEYDVLCLAEFNDSSKASTSISFEGGAATTAYISVVVKNICNDEVIPNATVTITGANFSQSGYTDSNGKYTTTAKGTVGSTYSILITASGYDNSNLDILKNDSFVLADPIN